MRHDRGQEAVGGDGQRGEPRTRRSWTLAVWALAAGAGLAALAIATDGLLAPIVAHAVYDFVALIWVQRLAKQG